MASSLGFTLLNSPESVINSASPNSIKKLREQMQSRKPLKKKIVKKEELNFPDYLPFDNEDNMADIDDTISDDHKDNVHHSGDKHSDQSNNNIQTNAIDNNLTKEAFDKMNSTYAKEYYSQYIPFTVPDNENMATTNTELVKKIKLYDTFIGRTEG